jgi:XTP/dITP diphosphohydrolase
MRILIATKNKGKFGEIHGVLKDVPGVEFVFLGDLVEEFGDFDDSDFAEDGETHAENSYKKARYYYDRLAEEHGFDYSLGEDSGVYVDALADELGIKTRRWGAGHDASDEDWLAHFMEEMGRRAPAEDDRGARFVCHASLVGDGVGEEEGSCEGFEGETMGGIATESLADILPGLPLSSVFVVDGFEKAYAELSQEEKNQISHRGQAISKFKKWLLGRLG